MRCGDVQREVDQPEGQKGWIADAHPEQIVTRADAKTPWSSMAIVAAAPVDSRAGFGSFLFFGSFRAAFSLFLLLLLEKLLLRLVASRA